MVSIAVLKDFKKELILAQSFGVSSPKLSRTVSQGVLGVLGGRRGVSKIHAAGVSRRQAEER